MKKAVLIIAGALLTVALSGGGVYFWMSQGAHGKSAEPVTEPAVTGNRFVSLDKVIVMLKSAPEGGAMQYMVVDLVFRTSEKQEAEVKTQLPLLKSLAVRSLSLLDGHQAAALGVDAHQQRLSKAYVAAFGKERREMPFSEVMVSKLIVE
ncbi:flagellar basal body-associated FliL family protein [Craterilacuibacter sp.]|uniref:flagellar basal body-associated FliL family protein n=1 Tax=Craterilacuibacter sp. TaxID=2870909 RepID=UPI003F344484